MRIHFGLVAVGPASCFVVEPTPLDDLEPLRHGSVASIDPRLAVLVCGVDVANAGYGDPDDFANAGSDASDRVLGHWDQRAVGTPGRSWQVQLFPSRSPTQRMDARIEPTTLIPAGRATWWEGAKYARPRCSCSSGTADGPKSDTTSPISYVEGIRPGMSRARARAGASGRRSIALTVVRMAIIVIVVVYARAIVAASAAEYTGENAAHHGSQPTHASGRIG